MQNKIIDFSVVFHARLPELPADRQNPTSQSKQSAAVLPVFDLGAEFWASPAPLGPRNNPNTPDWLVWTLYCSSESIQ
jgi:hypothetical protein